MPERLQQLESLFDIDLRLPACMICQLSVICNVDLLVTWTCLIQVVAQLVPVSFRIDSINSSKDVVFAGPPPML